MSHYDWLTEPRDGSLCVASEWMPAWSSPIETRLVFRVAPATDDNAWLLTTHPHFDGRLTLVTGMGYGRPLLTEIHGNTQAHYVDERPVPQPRTTRRRCPKMNPPSMKTTTHEWANGAWRPVVDYVPMNCDTCAHGSAPEWPTPPECDGCTTGERWIAQ